MIVALVTIGIMIVSLVVGLTTRAWVSTETPVTTSSRKATWKLVALAHGVSWLALLAAPVANYYNVKGHDIPHPGVTKIPHPISQD
jgi:cytochrome b561